MEQKEKIIPRLQDHPAPPPRPNVAAVVESVFGCKWSLQILLLIRQGVCRPGAIKRSVPGLTTKVQSGCLAKMLGYGILERTVFPEVPPHVEYRITPVGERFAAILDAIEELQRDEETCGV
jgi:DNA-binding HxlR family transcriptional regulator